MELDHELNAIFAADFPHAEDVQQLAEFLYERCYTTSILDPPRQAATPRRDDDLTPLLAAANQGRPTWDEGWRFDQELADGSVLARKDGAARAFRAGEYLCSRGLGYGPEPGSPMSVFIAPGCATLQPDFYYAFGETAGEIAEDESLVRFYWNISADGAPMLVENLTREFNRFQLPFRFKCVSRRSRYPRRDAAVLYVHRRYYAISAMLIEALQEGLVGFLQPATPLFTKRLAPGHALAEDPPLGSFGQHRCRILAYALVQSQAQTPSDRKRVLARCMTEEGLSLDRPWLNRGSEDAYAFPFPG